MPSKAKRPCPMPGCPNLTDGGYCPAHKAERDRQSDELRGTSRQRGYTHIWEKVRARKLARDPLCEDCLDERVVEPAVLVHHLDGNPRNNRMSNLRSVCVHHHAKRHSKKINESA